MISMIQILKIKLFINFQKNSLIFGTFIPFFSQNNKLLNLTKIV